MVSTKTQRLRDRVRAEVKHAKQTALGDLPEKPKAELVKAEAPAPKKQIEITEISTSTREDELVLKICFKLMPTRTAFSRVTADLYFDEQKIDSLRLRVLQGPLATANSEFSSALDMTGIGEGQHKLRVEIYELWSENEKLAFTSKEVAIEYIPIRREDKLIRVPIIKSVAGGDLTIVSDSEKRIFREMDEEMKKEPSHNSLDGFQISIFFKQSGQ